MKNYYKVLGGILIISAVLVFWWLILGNQPTDQPECKIDSDCALVYIGSDICFSCNTSIEEYKCLPFKEAKQIEEEHLKKLIDNNIACEKCLEEPQHICTCSNGKCEKIEKQLTQQVIITTDKTEYKQRDTVKITVKNNLEKDICYLSYQGSVCYETPYTIYQFSSGNWKYISTGLVVECPQVELPPLCNELKFNEEKEFIWDHRGQASIGKYKVSINHKEDIEEIKLGNTKGIKTIYSNEFTIK